MDPAPEASVAVSEACPVLGAWSKCPVVMAQLAKSKKMLVLQHKKLNRAVLVDNMEALAPLINHLGNLASNASLYVNS